MVPPPPPPPSIPITHFPSSALYFNIDLSFIPVVSTSSRVEIVLIIVGLFKISPEEFQSTEFFDARVPTFFNVVMSTFDDLNCNTTFGPCVFVTSIAVFDDVTDCTEPPEGLNGTEIHFVPLYCRMFPTATPKVSTSSRSSIFLTNVGLL